MSLARIRAEEDVDRRVRSIDRIPRQSPSVDELCARGDAILGDEAVGVARTLQSTSTVTAQDQTHRSEEQFPTHPSIFHSCSLSYPAQSPLCQTPPPHIPSFPRTGCLYDTTPFITSALFSMPPCVCIVSMDTSRVYRIRNKRNTSRLTGDMARNLHTLLCEDESPSVSQPDSEYTRQALNLTVFCVFVLIRTDRS